MNKLNKVSKELQKLYREKNIPLKQVTVNKVIIVIEDYDDDIFKLIFPKDNLF